MYGKPPSLAERPGGVRGCGATGELHARRPRAARDPVGHQSSSPRPRGRAGAAALRPAGAGAAADPRGATALQGEHRGAPGAPALTRTASARPAPDTGGERAAVVRGTLALAPAASLPAGPSRHRAA